MDVPVGFDVRERGTSFLLRAALTEIGRPPVDVPAVNRSTIVSVPFEGGDPARLLADLKAHGITCAARDGNLRFAMHLYNHEDDIARLTTALSEIRP